MKYFPEASYAEPTLDAADSELPGDYVPYFLRAGEGPRLSSASSSPRRWSARRVAR